MSELILVNVVGTDRPGLTHSLTTILERYQVRVLDIGQAVIHDHLSLGMLIEVPHGEASYLALKDLLFEAHELGLSIRFSPLQESEYDTWVQRQSQTRTIITVIGWGLPASVLARLTGVLKDQGLNIEKISRLSRRVPRGGEEERASCVELSVLGDAECGEDLREKLMAITQSEPVDIAIQADDMFRRNRRMVVFDMDSTLIQCEVIDELARVAGVGDRVAEITERAMQGELDFKESFSERLGLLKGLSAEKVEEIAENLPLTEGAEELIATLKKLGYFTVICSGGFSVFGKKLQTRLGIDEVFANELEIVDGMVTGRVIPPVVDGLYKAKVMRDLADREGYDLRQVIAVGDGANDLPMIQQAGLGIAFRAKPIVRQQASQSISVLGLDAILYLLGVRDRELSHRLV